MPTYVIIFQHISAYFNIFPHVSTYVNIFQPISTLFNLFQPISTFFNLFQPISSYLNPFQLFSTFLIKNIGAENLSHRWCDWHQKRERLFRGLTEIRSQCRGNKEYLSLTESSIKTLAKWRVTWYLCWRCGASQTKLETCFAFRHGTLISAHEEFCPRHTVFIVPNMFFFLCVVFCLSCFLWILCTSLDWIQCRHFRTLNPGSIILSTDFVSCFQLRVEGLPSLDSTGGWRFKHTWPDSKEDTVGSWTC